MDKQHPPEAPDDPAPLAPADPTLGDTARILDVSLRVVYRLIAERELDTYVLVRRRVTAASIRRYRAKRLAAGPQLEARAAALQTRRPGRPPKDRAEEHPLAE
jgi:hypothetical protein